MAADTTVWSQAGETTLQYFMQCDAKRREQVETFERQIQDLEGVNQNLMNDNERLFQANVDLEATKKVLEKNAREYETELNNNIQTLEQQSESRRVKLLNLENLLKTTQQEVQSLQSIKKKLEEQVVDCQNVYEENSTLKEEFNQLEDKLTVTANAYQAVNRKVELIYQEKVTLQKDNGNLQSQMARLQDAYNVGKQSLEEYVVKNERLIQTNADQEEIIKKAHQDQTELERRIETRQQELESCRQSLSTQEQRIVGLRRDYTNAEDDYHLLKQGKDKLEAQLKNLQDLMPIKEEQLRAGQNVNNQLQHDIQQQRQEVSNLRMTQDEMAKHLVEMETAKMQVEAETSRLAQANDELQQEARRAETSLERLRKQLENTANKSAENFKRVGSLEQEVQTLSAQVSDLNNDIESLHEENTGIAALKDKCEAENRSLQTQLNKLYQDNVALNNQVKSMPTYENVRREAQKSLTRLEDEIARLKQENNQLLQRQSKMSTDLAALEGANLEHVNCKKRLEQQLERLRGEARKILIGFDNVFQGVERHLLDNTLKQQFRAKYRNASDKIEELQ